MKIGIFIVAFNAESLIERTLYRIPRRVWDEANCVYVLDDCSTDETVSKAIALKAKYPKLRVIRNRLHAFYGGSQKVGYQYAIDQGLDIVVTLHADGKYAPELIETLYAPIIHDKADLVLGSRMLIRTDARAGHMPRYKYWGNLILTRMENRLAGLHLSEFHTGYRAYRVSFLRAIPFWENTDEWHFDTETLLQAHAARIRIKEVPIPTYYGNEIQQVNGILYGWNCLATAFSFWLFRRGLYYCRKFDVHLKGKVYFSKLSDPHSSHSIIDRHLRRLSLAGKRVLELGVGDATLTRRLKEYGALVTCVELDPEMAQLAEPFAQKVKVANLETIPDVELREEYDLILAADILEHLVDPLMVLSRLKACLKPGGKLIVSLPNVAHAYVRLSLLAGRFRYHSKGILDRTHLHFYTLRSAREMLVRTGWQIDSETVSATPLAMIFPFLSTPLFRWALSLGHGVTRLFKGLFAYQHILYCSNPNQSDLL